MPRSKMESAAKRLAGGLREIANYPAPDNATLDRVNIVIEALEEDEGRSGTTMSINLAVDLLAAHWNRLLEAPKTLYSMSRDNFPLLEAQIQRLLHFRDLYVEERNHLEWS